MLAPAGAIGAIEALRDNALYGAFFVKSDFHSCQSPSSQFFCSAPSTTSAAGSVFDGREHDSKMRRRVTLRIAGLHLPNRGAVGHRRKLTWF
jgi:hypothetical protein